MTNAAQSGVNVLGVSALCVCVCECDALASVMNDIRCHLEVVQTTLVMAHFWAWGSVWELPSSQIEP